MMLALVWPMACTDQMLANLVEPDRVFELRLSYKRHRGRGVQVGDSVLAISYRDIWVRLNNGQSGLADLSVRNQADRRFAEAFARFDVGEVDAAALRDAMWWPIYNPDQPLDYPLDDVEGAPRLRFRNDLTFGISGRYTVEDLCMMRDEHRRLVEAIARARVDCIKAFGIELVRKR